MSVLDDLGTLLGKAATLSLPGIVAASAFAVYLWPPAPVDTIEVAELCSASQLDSCKPQPKFATLNFPISDHKTKNEDALQKVARYAAEEGKPACGTKPDTLLRQKTLFDYDVPVYIQQELDSQIQIYLICLQEENARQGQEESLISIVNANVTQLNTELAKVDDAYQGYAASNNPLSSRLKAKLDARKLEISQWQTVGIQLKLIEQERTRRVQDLTREQNILSARQADPGRLRPRQKFDDVLASMGSHITGFATLAIAWSMLLTPVSQALFSGLYATVYKYNWDYVREDRGLPIRTLEEIAEQVSSGS